MYLLMKAVNHCGQTVIFLLPEASGSLVQDIFLQNMLDINCILRPENWTDPCGFSVA